ncbi:hypothetical protein VTK26DRAFT_3385 [Humicola hyalothermophila]
MIPKGRRLLDLDWTADPGRSMMYGIVDFDRRHFLNLTVLDTGTGVGEGGRYATAGEEPSAMLYGEKFLYQLCDELDPDICAITVNPDTGEVVSKSTGPQEHDLGACWPHYPTPEELGLPSHVKTIRRSELLELQRLAPSVDLVSYKSESGRVEKAVFKYYFAPGDVHRRLREQQVLLHIGEHPNLTGLDLAVLDDSGQVVVGYLAKYSPAGNLLDNSSRPFKLSWLKQLIKVVDDMNLEYGIAHGNIQLEHILIDEANDMLKLSDMGHSSPMTGPGDLTDVWMTTSAVYELITGSSLPLEGSSGPRRETAYLLRNLDAVGDWTPRPEIQLEDDIAAYQLVLQDWVNKRRSRDQPP